MAAPMDFTGTGVTTIEGQLAMILEAIMNLQDDTTADTGSNRDDIQIILANTYNDITGGQATTLQMTFTSTGTADGYTLVADEVFYPKVRS